MKNFIESSNALALRFGAGIKPKSSEDWNATTGSSVTLASRCLALVSRNNRVRNILGDFVVVGYFH